MSLPNPTFIGQQATVAGKTYEAVSIDPPMWKAITTGTTKQLLSDHLTNVDGAHDDIYIRTVTLAEAQAVNLETGQRVTLTDYANAAYKVVVDSDTGGFYLPYKAGFKFKLDLSPTAAITPEALGVIEGFDTSNAEKIEFMIESGFSVDWGDKAYGVDRCLGSGRTLPKPIDWKSNGCRIYLEAGSPHQQAVLWYQILPVKHFSDGALIFDANQTANVGILLENVATPAYPIGYGQIKFNNIEGVNPKRTLDYIKGGGIIIEGAFTSVILNSPKATGCILATGAGIPNSQGIAGIEVVRDGLSGGYSLYTEINNPDIANITSEDNTYYQDQDGIKVFGEAIGGVITLQSTAVISGGVYRNCWGRSIKAQVTNLTVSSPTFIRDTGWAGSNAQAEIDSQFCKPTVTAVNCVYSNYAPDTILAYSSHPNGAANAGFCDGISISGNNNVTVPSIVAPFSYLGMGRYEVRNVEVLDAIVETPVLYRCVDDTAEIECSNWRLSQISDVFAKVLKQGRDTPTATLGRIKLNDIVNDGSSVNLVEARVSGSVLSADLVVTGRIIGFNNSDTRLAITAINPPQIDKVNGLSGHYINGSYFRPLASSIDAGATFEFDTHGYVSSCRIVVVNSGVSKESNCILSCSTTGIILLSPESTGVDIGQTSEPTGTGSLKIWVNSVTGGLFVKNNTASGKVVTVYYL